MKILFSFFFFFFLNIFLTNRWVWLPERFSIDSALKESCPSLTPGNGGPLLGLAGVGPCEEASGARVLVGPVEEKGLGGRQQPVRRLREAGWLHEGQPAACGESSAR